MRDSDELLADNNSVDSWRDRRAGAGGSTGSNGKDDDVPAAEKYEAYKSVDREPPALSIYTNGSYPADAHVDYRHYQYILALPGEKVFDVIFGFFVIQVKGRNLAPVIHALKNRKCTFLQRYVRRAGWLEPGRDDTVIDEIKISYKVSDRTALLEKTREPEKA